MNSTFQAFASELNKNQKTLIPFILSIPALSALEGIDDARKNKYKLKSSAIYGGSAVGIPSALFLAAAAIKHKQIPPVSAMFLPPVLGGIGAMFAAGSYGIAHELTKRIPHATAE
jgi:hypothetical protein